MLLMGGSYRMLLTCSYCAELLTLSVAFRPRNDLMRQLFSPDEESEAQRLRNIYVGSLGFSLPPDGPPAFLLG